MPQGQDLASRGGSLSRAAHSEWLHCRGSHTLLQSLWSVGSFPKCKGIQREAAGGGFGVLFQGLEKGARDVRAFEDMLEAIGLEGHM